MSLAVELTCGLEQCQELVDLEDATRSPSLELLTRPAATSDITRHPAGVLGLVEDHSQCAKRLVNRFIRERAQFLTRAPIRQGCPHLCRGSNPSIVGMDVAAVLLHPFRGDLRRKQLAEERREITTELPLIQIGCSGPDRWILLESLQPVGGELPEGRLLVVARAIPRAPGRQSPSSSLATCCLRATSARASSQPSEVLPSGTLSSAPSRRTRSP
jgi:hypothetical protein